MPNVSKQYARSVSVSETLNRHTCRQKAGDTTRDLACCNEFEDSKTIPFSSSVSRSLHIRSWHSAVIPVTDCSHMTSHMYAPLLLCYMSVRAHMCLAKACARGYLAASG